MLCPRHSSLRLPLFLPPPSPFGFRRRCPTTSFGDVSAPYAFSRMRGLGFPWAGLRWVGWILRPEPAGCSRPAGCSVRVFRRGIARVVRVKLLWEIGFAEGVPYPPALILRMVPLPTGGAVRVPAVQALEEIPFVGAPHESTAVVGKGTAVEYQDAWAIREPYMSLRGAPLTRGDLAAKWDTRIVYTNGRGFEGHVGAVAVVPRWRAAGRYLGQGARAVVSGTSQWRWKFLWMLFATWAARRPIAQRGHPLDELTPRQRGTIAVRWVPGHAGVQGAKEAKKPSAGPEQILVTALKWKERQEAHLAWERQWTRDHRSLGQATRRLIRLLLKANSRNGGTCPRVAPQPYRPVFCHDTVLAGAVAVYETAYPEMAPFAATVADGDFFW
ncbi:hypothetical protein CNMCM8694_008065 [Aspergillus lentulus]|nr:hypothetical protein CNMCM8060_002690 [Aspergillus lentulus]KAF4194020.1 hypothetical protein CNMCM8694_008065 [Aspergillus lentulus]